jgi:hypothetical protein
MPVEQAQAARTLPAVPARLVRQATLVCPPPERAQHRQMVAVLVRRTAAVAVRQATLAVPLQQGQLALSAAPTDQSLAGTRVRS